MKYYIKQITLLYTSNRQKRFLLPPLARITKKSVRYTHKIALSTIIIFSLFNCQNAEKVIEKTTPSTVTPGYSISNTTSSLYSVEIVASSSDTPMVAKSKLTLKVLEKANANLPKAGLALTLSPMMTMSSGMSHATPQESTSDNGNGSYSLNLYYVMPSYGNTGEKMGDWKISISIAGDSTNSVAFISPIVGGMMTNRIALKGTDTYVMNAMNVKKTYYIFVKSISGSNGNKSLTLFLSRVESMMMTAPITGATVHVYDDSGSSVLMTDSGSGLYTKAPLNISSNLHLKLVVSGEQKTASGSSVSGCAYSDTNCGDFGHLTLGM